MSLLIPPPPSYQEILNDFDLNKTEEIDILRTMFLLFFDETPDNQKVIELSDKIIEGQEIERNRQELKFVLEKLAEKEKLH
jgi:hypothetical protein